MAQRLSLQFPFRSLHPPTAKLSNQTLQFLHLKYPSLYPSLSTRSLKLPAKQSRYLIRATENDDKFQQSAAEVSSDDVGESSGGEELSELGAEIKRVMKEREAAGGGGGGFLSGVAEEIGQIEWPDFGKVLGTTGVVLGVIAGSSVVLLTLNAVLAELSDQVFAGKGIQDFFSG